MAFAELQSRADEAWEQLFSSRPLIIVGAGTCGIAAGAQKVITALADELDRRGVNATIMPVGCIGLCYAEVLVDIVRPGEPRVSYKEITPDIVPELVEDCLVRGETRPDLALGVFSKEDFGGVSSIYSLPVFRRQVRISLRNAGHIDPERIEHYIATGGYAGLATALEMSPEAIVDEVKRSGLRGRGGAGFPAGVKWELCRKSPGDEKYMICNGDEGDPGAFMNRSVMEGDPHSVIEGMAIAGYAIGAQNGYIYVRAEYPLAVKRLQMAIRQAEEHGLLGDNIMDSDFSFHLKIKEGAGAFVCGEETALIASIEGKRGMPRPRPPFPAQAGLWGKPSNVNNVETISNVPVIITKGADWFASYGTEKSKGTKTFALAGKINRPGLVEVPMGITLRDVVYDIGGGIPDHKSFKAAQTGGPIGGCLPSRLLDLPIDYESLTQAGAMMGSGGLIVMDESTCMVDVAKYFLTFAQAESCGKCVPCRVGSKQMLEIMEDIAAGRGKREHIEELRYLSKLLKLGSLCALGGGTPNPILSTLEHFMEEYEEHIYDKHCAAGVCKELVVSPCQNTCPLGTPVPDYVGLIAKGDFKGSLDLVREDNPFPGVCGRVCPRPCEKACRRGQVDEPVAICDLKRFIADEGGLPEIPEPAPVSLELGRVAIVGSGPAGLTAAYHLSKQGCRVTVFEALPVVGGMMAVGIPEYRLPRDILDAEIQLIEKMGVEIRTGVRIGKDIDLEELFARGFKAVFLAVGAHRSNQLGIPGEEAEGVVHGTSFLRDVNLNGRRSMAGQSVAVVGGGDVAIDAARSALRLGAKEVHMLYRRTGEEMPAQAAEINAGSEEGVRFHYLTAPTRVLAESGRVRALECRRMALGGWDSSGRRRPEPVEGSEFDLDVDLLIPAIGQSPDLGLLGGNGSSELVSRGLIVADRRTLATSRPGVFAGGDAVTGPATVIEAIAAGAKAAKSITRYLQGQELFVSPELPEKQRPAEAATWLPAAEGAPRVRMPHLPPRERTRGFAEVETGLTRENAMREASRCLRCDWEE